MAGSGLAQAQTTSAAGRDGSVDALRAEAAAVAHDYFAALNHARELDAEIAEAEATITTLEANAEAAKAAATARAVAAYRQSGSRLSAVVDSNDLMAASRRAWLVDQVDQRDHEAYARLHQASADLREQRKELDARRAAQAGAVADLQKQAASADAKLAVAQRAAAEQAAQQAAQQAAASAAAGAAAGAGAAGAGSTGSPPTTGGASSALSPTTTTAAPSKPVAPPGYTGTPGTNPNHGDPTLSCIRARESGGNYGAVSRDGNYLGAYQFSQSTWNIAAARAGRSDLVGVPVNTATPFDQDAVAWALLQSQGLGPWGGHCP